MKGETPTYIAVYRDAKTGEPFKIPANFTHPIVKFTVRDSVYDIGTPRFEYNLDWDTAITVKGGGHRLDDTVLTYDGTGSWDNNYFNSHSTSQTALYRKENANGEYDYAYFGNDDAWHDYSFRLVFPFNYDDTKNLEPKTYSYEIVLFDYANQDGTTQIDESQVQHKMPILAPTEFIVGGTLSE